MIPITRKENYLNEIVGWGETAPEKPLTPEEFFFAAILGEAVQTPEPLSRYQIYLAKIAGRNISVPKPLTRLELFLAKACGMDIETLTPITREEIFWSNYSAIVDFELEGVPPLTYKAIEGTLENYRIYGDTVDGESVGDRTANLFDINNLEDHYDISVETGLPTQDSAYSYNRCAITTPITVSAGDYYLTFNKNIAGEIGFIVSVFENNTLISRTSGYYSGSRIRISSGNNIYIGFHNQNVAVAIHPSDISNIMLNSGSTPLPYEPYGYKVPVTVEGKNLLPNTATSKTNNGVTFTVNSDGSVTCNGTANGGTALFGIPAITLPAGQYSINGCPVGGDESTTYKILILANNEWLINDKGSGANFTLTETSTVSVRIAIYNGYTCDNLTFYPMIRRVDIEDDTYEPYHAPVTTPIYLPEPIKMVGDEAEYIDYAEQKQHRVRKNLFDFDAFASSIIKTESESGATSVQGQSITLTASINDYYTYPYLGNQSGVYKIPVLPNAKYVLSWEADNNKDGRIYIFLNGSLSDAQTALQTEKSIKFATQDDTTYVTIRFGVYSAGDSITYSNIQLNKGSTPLPYEPYIENTEVDVTLPALPTIKGTNVLSVGTAVQPSKVYVKYKGERQ